MRGTNSKRNSWVNQKFNFDIFYRQINITTVKGPLDLMFLSIISKFDAEMVKHKSRYAKENKALQIWLLWL